MYFHGLRSSSSWVIPSLNCLELGVTVAVAGVDWCWSVSEYEPRGWDGGSPGRDISTRAIGESDDMSAIYFLLLIQRSACFQPPMAADLLQPREAELNCALGTRSCMITATLTPPRQCIRRLSCPPGPLANAYLRFYASFTMTQHYSIIRTRLSPICMV